MNISKKYGPGLIFVIAAAIFSISSAANYRFGSFMSPGPGLFPIIVAGVLFVIGIVSLISKIKIDPTPAYIDLKALSIIVLSLIMFAAMTKLVNMAAGIVALVWVSSLAVKESVPKFQSLKVSAVLLIAAMGFKYILGLNIPLWK